MNKGKKKRKLTKNLFNRLLLAIEYHDKRRARNKKRRLQQAA